MKKLLTYLVATSRLLVLALFVMVMSSLIIAFGQTPQIFDKHVGGDVPIDEQRTNATREGRRTSASPEDRVIKQGVLAPPKEDRATLAAFLHLPNTGLIRLLPPGALTYHRGSPLIPGDGSYYSFANITHALDHGADIELNRDQLSVGFTDFGYGFMTNLGDVGLDRVELSDPRTRFSADYRAAVTFLDGRAEALRFRSPVVIDGTSYQTRLPVEVNSTYLLRSINYGNRLFGSTGRPTAINNPRRTDVLVAFRVIGKDTNASVIIAWKLLQNYPPPRLD